MAEGTLFDQRCTPGLDCSRIDWPSNRITAKQMRDAAPLLYNNLRYTLEHGDIEALGILYNFERLAAERVYARALGGRDPDAMAPRSMILEQMEDSYPKYGICSGKEQCKELLRKIEDAAIAQAVAKGGKDPRKLRSR